jgi:cation transport protein ChaC
MDEQARIIAHAIGGRGPNRDYLWSTAAHLAELGIADPDLEWLAAEVRRLT